ncbi:two-component system sensor histidine kinase NtrB [Halobellus rubicundus]|uniref:histidine kinase n=1 Tax=Halobellus rubicundus TaxID=2996466 RepID=A0ABD5MB34_9EURY
MARGEGDIDLEVVSRNQMEPTIAIDADGTIAFANQRFCDIGEFSESEVVGDDYARFGEIIESGFEELRAAVEAVLAGDAEEERVELSMHHPEGAPVPRRLPSEARVTPVYDDGARIGAIVSLRRIGKRKAYERQLERQNDRLEEFAGVVAHDLRNPLNIVEGNLEIAREDCDSPHLDAIGDAVDRMWTIVEETLELAKQGRHVGETEPVILSELVGQCWTIVDTHEAALETEGDATILADPDRLRSLFENLFRNAIDHGTDADRADLTVRVGVLDDGFYLEDDGPGIPADKREKVFDLGFSTAADGTGYGLAIVRWIAEAHGWDVQAVESEVGSGARFEFKGVEFAP